MGMDASSIAASIAKSMEMERTPSATQRASDVSQGLLAEESVAVLHQKKTTKTERVQQEKVRRERERKRRELERRMAHRDSDESDDGGRSVLDVVA